MGSLIGTIDISNNTISNHFNYCLIPNSDEILKIESVSIVEEITHGKTRVILISDDDLGNSTILEGILNW